MIPLLYLLFGKFQGQLLYLGNQVLKTDTYNAYLSISDTLLFTSLLFLAINSKNIYAIFIYLISVILLFLLGSRIAFVFAIIALILLTFENIASIFIRTSSILMLKAKKVFLNKRMISVSFIFIVLSLLSFSLNVFSIQNIAVNYISIITENILASRIWNSIFGDNYYIYVYSDNSLNTRIDLFQCHINVFFSSAKTLFFGTKLENGNLICGNYIHSSLSLITEFGLLISLFFISIVYICLKQISKFYTYLIKWQSFRNIFVFMMLFLIHGLVARHGVTYYLPALILCYSITLQFNDIRKYNK